MGCWYPYHAVVYVTDKELMKGEKGEKKKRKEERKRMKRKDKREST